MWEAIPILKHAETILGATLGPAEVKTKDARLTWLTARRMAGERMTREEVQEAFRLHEEVFGRTMGEVHRETQVKAQGEKGDGEAR